jgi:hypothetical protein
MFSSPSVEGKLRQGRIIAAWEDVIGERIGEQVEKSWLKDGKLFVRIKSPVWRQELHLNRASWCRRLNDELDGDEVTEIVFR